MNLSTRPALYTPACNRPTLGLEKGISVKVDVFGIYQVSVDYDVDAYFVVQLPDGRCTYASVDTIKFLDVCSGEENTK